MKSDAQIKEICDKLASGNSLRAIAKELQLNEATVRYWLYSDEQAFTHSARARELGCDALADECLEIADGPGDPADKRIKIDTRIRLIGKWSQRYSDKVTVKSESTVTHKYDLDSLSNERLDELERILADASTGKGSEGEAVTSSVH